MEVHTHHAGILLFVAASQQARDDTRQHVAAACCGHACIARGVEDYVAVWQADGGVVTFQDDIALQPHGQVARLPQSFVAVSGMSLQSVKLLGVGSEDDVLWQLLEPSAMTGKHIDGIGIDDHRALGASQL